LHLITIALSSVPAAMVIVAMYLLLLRAQVSRRSAVSLSLALAFGSLLFPYSGALVSQVPVAAALIWAWWFLFDRPFLAGLLIALAGMCDYVAAPLFGLFLVCLLFRRATSGGIVRFFLAPILVLLIVSVINHTLFGSFAATTYSNMDPYFRRDNLFLGQFHAPQVRVLYWITYHRMRGLFVCCPMFILPIFSLVALRRSSFTLERIVPMVIVLYFVMVILTFVGWTGGWGIGPRYLIPALPFLWLFAAAGFARFPLLSLLLIALSGINMLAATSVQVFYPANDSGPPTHWDPVSFTWLGFARGQLAKSPESYNLGLLVGLPGLMSLAPLLIVVAIFWVLISRHLSAAAASDRTASAQRAYIAPEGCNPSPASSESNLRDSGEISM
jgi:hypothetical protein